MSNVKRQIPSEGRLEREKFNYVKSEVFITLWRINGAAELCPSLSVGQNTDQPGPHTRDLCWELENAALDTWQLSWPDLWVCLLCLHHKSPPPGLFSSGIYWPKTTCVKKCFEILPDNRYEIFEKTCCPQVNEILQVADFATGANTFPVYYLLPFCKTCFNQRGRFFICVTLSPHQFIKGKLRGIIKRDFPQGLGEFCFFWTRTFGQVCLRSIQVAKHLEKNCDM